METTQAWKIEIPNDEKEKFERKIKQLLSYATIDSKIVGTDLISYFPGEKSKDPFNYLVFLWWECPNSLEQFNQYLKSKYNGNPRPETFKEMYLELEEYFSEDRTFKVPNIQNILEETHSLIKSQRYIKRKKE